MRGGGDGCGVSAIEPHPPHVHSSREDRARPLPRRSTRRENVMLSVGCCRDAHANGRAEGSVRNGFVANGASASSIDLEGDCMASIGQGEESSRAAMRGGDGAQSGALDTYAEQSSKDLKRGPLRKRTGRRESPAFRSMTNGQHRVESSMKKGGEGPVRNGVNGNGAASSSSMAAVEPAPRAQRASAGAPPRGRSAKRLRSRGNGVNGSVSRVNSYGMLLQDSAPEDSTAAVIQHSEKECLELVEADDRTMKVGEIFPLLPDELGWICLTRLPRYKIYELGVVCKKWREFLSSPELYKARRLLGLREDWVFILGNNQDKSWRAFLPAIGKWVILPSCPSDYTFDSCDKESMVAGLNLLVLGQNKDGYVIWKFDTINSKWSTTPRMNTDRCMFGSATFGKYAYFAGGTSRGTLLSTVERYDSDSNSWESLAEMNHARKACSGFVMDGKFHVIGGQIHNQVNSTTGEEYDPQTGVWTVIEGMWPLEFVPSTGGSPPLVAVLNNNLYALNTTQNMLMLYNKELNKWKTLEKVPFRAENANGWGLGFKAVGDELFVIGGARSSSQFLPKIHAYKPRVADEDCWRHVTDLKIPTNGFIYNCAVMSG